MWRSGLMKVRSEASRGGESLAVELADSDGAQMFAEWANWSVNRRTQELQKAADRLVVVWMVRNGLITQEFGKQRLGELA